MKKALISVSDKTNLIEFVKGLVECNYEIISTGGTKKYLEDNNIKVIGIEEVTGFPEILDGRVKTLHPKVHGGLLSLRDNEKHLKQVKENNIEFIDMVVVNLYPFKETIEKGCTLSEAIENIDIGGPSMLRSAAKNYKFVDVLCDYNDYDKVLKEIKENKETSLETKTYLAVKVFKTTASYDTLISNYLNEVNNTNLNNNINLSYELLDELRYGENPHQKAHFYKGLEKGYSLAYSEKYQGKELSYNNIQDGNACLNIVKEFDEPVIVAVKHMNPCGVGIGKDINEAWDKAYEADKVSIFGGIVGTNQKVTKEVALKMNEVFLELVLAPDYDEEALKVFSKKKNLRVLKYVKDDNVTTKQIVSMNGGLLVQDLDNYKLTKEDLKVVTKAQPSEEEVNNLLFLMKVCKHVKSNAIVVGNNNMTYGVGPGQTNRIGACNIALNWARDNGHTENLLLASDAFFPFDDCVKLAHQYGVKAIIQPGGSIRDEDSIKACDELGISMIFTNIRHFKH